VYRLSSSRAPTFAQCFFFPQKTCVDQNNSCFNDHVRDINNSKRRDLIMSISIGEIVVWLIVGALAGTLAARVITFTKRGYGLWVNMGVGMLGALVGGFLFRLFHIDFGFGQIKITFEDLISAFVGSLLCIIAWRLIRKSARRKKGAVGIETRPRTQA
jgi:uncharacterized membrane protein YeaQ/YmgE (transglycosylase-associated protein family)